MFFLKAQYIYQGSKNSATLQLWYIQFLPGWSGLGRNQVYFDVALPKWLINYFKPVQQSRLQVLRAYCPNIYTLYEGKEDLEWGDMAKMAFDILLCCAEKAKTGKVLKLV